MNVKYNTLNNVSDNFSKPTWPMVERNISVDSQIQYNTQDQDYTYDKRDKNYHTRSMKRVTSTTYANNISESTDPIIPMVDSIPISTSVIDIPRTGRNIGTENYHTQRLYGNQDENYHTHHAYDNRDENFERNIFTLIDTDHVPTAEQYIPPNEPPNGCELTTGCELVPNIDDSIHMNRKIYRPPLESVYIEPDIGPDLLDGMQILYQDYGKSLRKAVEPLPPRDDIIDFNISTHGAELEKNLNWDQCPDSAKSPSIDIIKEYWDVFCKEGLRNNIRGFTFRVDTGY